MKILITGAHFTPALAVIEELRKISGVEVIYVGRSTTLEGDKTWSVESEVLSSKSIKFIPIITGRLQRSFTIYTIPSLLKIPIGLLQALFIFFTEKPDVILSFGGYVAVPTVLIGWLWSIPIIIHEQTLVSGLANEISALFADKICLSFPQNPFSKKDNATVTGNPIRKEILYPGKVDSEYERIFETAAKEKFPVILITGGNQGSHILNLAVEEVLEKLTKIAVVIQVSGDNKFRDFERMKELQSDRFLVKKWIGKEWGELVSKADLVVSRAGINTLVELAYFSKPALIIPIPYLYQDEQNKNAKYFEELGLAEVLPQSKLSSKTLFQKIKEMLKSLNTLKESARKAKEVLIPDAAKRLALETILLAKHD